MRDLGQRKELTTDRDFELAGFDVVPARPIRRGRR